MRKFIQVLTTTEKREDAERIARLLVEKRLAACVQIVGPVMSAYRWKGKVEETEEWQCLIKSREDLFSEVEKTVRSVHPYETPEIIATAILAGSGDYLEWLQDELAGC
ncbi:MAG: divalent-cation tolerance protein CutA [Deltaproteobacteria bacterium]|nr:divalent-cation tolerance protein CutA [Deltaproteobacteria bacterium]